MLQYQESIDTPSDSQPIIQATEEINIRQRFLNEFSNINEKKLAKQLGVSLGSYVKWRNGYSSPKTDLAVHKHYGVPYRGKTPYAAPKTNDVWVTIAPSSQMQNLRNGFTLRTDYISLTDIAIQYLDSEYVTVQSNGNGQIRLVPGESPLAYRLRPRSGTETIAEIRSKVLVDWMKETGLEVGSFYELKYHDGYLIYG